MLGYANIVSIVAILAHIHFCVSNIVDQDQGEYGEVPNTSFTNTSSTTLLKKETFYITRVGKVETTDSFQVTVEYQASSQPKTYFMPHFREAPVMLENQELGVLRLVVPKDRMEPFDMFGNSVIVFFEYPDHRCVAHLELYDTPASMDVPRTSLDITQGSDVIFRPGSDAELDVRMKVEGEKTAIEEDELDFTAFLKSETEANRVDRYHVDPRYHEEDEVWVEVVRERGEKGERHNTYRFNSTLPDPRGILEVSWKLRFACREGCLLSRLSTTTVVRFYGQGQPGPFPQGFLGFIQIRHQPDNSRLTCDQRKLQHGTCPVTCQVVGNEPSTISLDEVLPNGDVIPSEEPTSIYNLGQWSTARLEFSNAKDSDGGHYRCTATSASGQISMDMVVTVLRRAQILTNLTTMVRLENGSLAATCIAQGKPAPNVTFDLQGHHRVYASAEDYEVTVTQLDESTTRADILVTNPDVASKLDPLKCWATNDDSLFGHRDTHYLSLSDNVGTNYY